MTPRTRAAARLAFALGADGAGCSRGQRPAPRAESAAAAEPPGFGPFAGYPGATQVCSERVYGTDQHIVWVSYATPAEPAEVGAYYARRYGGAADAGCVLMVQRPGLHVLRVSARDDAASYPTCGTPLPRGARTVITMSQAIGPAVAPPADAGG